MTARGVAAVLLAAGASRRLGVPKQLLRDEAGESLVHRAARRLCEAGCAPVFVVTGAHADAVATELRDLDVRLVFNADHAEGMGRSIARGVAAVADDPDSADVTGVLIAACDMPTVDAAHLRALLATSEDGLRRAASQYVSPEGADDASMMTGIPAVFPAADFVLLTALAGDRGAKPLLMQTGTLPVRLFRGMFDLDTPAEVAAWRADPAIPPSLSQDPPMSSALATNGLADLEHEVALTRMMLERVPADHLDFSPHAKSWPLGKLAHHLCDFPWWGAYTLQSTEIDFAQPQPPQPPRPTDAAGFLALFDERMATFRTELEKATDAQMLETWTLRNGEQVIMAMPRIAVLRNMVISHMIHHRAQLTIYYRLLDVPVPGLYGPSADEQMPTHA